VRTNPFCPGTFWAPLLSAAGSLRQTRVTPQTSSSVQAVVLEGNSEFMALPTGTRLIARLQTPVSSAVKTPVVAAIEYNHERDGEIVIPAGSKAFGELSQVKDQGYVGTQFHHDPNAGRDDAED
jgi:hypothetical protein